MSIIRSNKVAYDFIDGEIVLERYTEFCRITSALSKNFKSLLGSGYSRVARGAYAGVFRSVWSEVLKVIGLLLAILSTLVFTYPKATEETLEPLCIMKSLFNPPGAPRTTLSAAWISQSTAPFSALGFSDPSTS